MAMFVPLCGYNHTHSVNSNYSTSFKRICQVITGISMSNLECKHSLILMNMGSDPTDSVPFGFGISRRWVVPSVLPAINVH